MTYIFSLVLKQLFIQHNISSVYHPESQCALERLQKTLKTMMKTYCKEFERGWDDGIALLLFALTFMHLADSFIQSNIICIILYICF